MIRLCSIAAWCLFLALGGCASVEPGTDAAKEETPAAEALAADAVPQGTGHSAAALGGPQGEEVGPDAALFGNDDEPEVSPEDFEEGFCADDIYAKYLTAHYAATHLPQKKAKSRPLAQASSSSKRHGKHRHRNRRHEDERYTKGLADFAALAYAHAVMAGPTTPYLGAIPIVVNDRVDFWVQYFKSGGRAQFMRWLVRGETMKPLVQPILQDGGVPMEFFYLAMIESGLSNSANSRARAIGTWQFMRGTAQLYGLKINHWVDERRDPFKSTIAAASYLKDLYADLGDWHLAMAAYNAGPGKVRRALKNNSNADFWHLCDTRDLAKETKEYVPKVLAAILLAADPQAHGFLVHPDGGLDFPDSTVLLAKPVRLEQLAHQLGVPLVTLKRWNPELLRNVTPPTKDGYALRLSSYYASRFPQIEPKLAAVELKHVQMHHVLRGETLARIAHRYRVGVKQILALNPDLSANRLRPGADIAIPVSGGVAATVVEREVL